MTTSRIFLASLSDENRAALLAVLIDASITDKPVKRLMRALAHICEERANEFHASAHDYSKASKSAKRRKGNASTVYDKDSNEMYARFRVWSQMGRELRTRSLGEKS